MGGQELAQAQLGRIQVEVIRGVVGRDADGARGEEIGLANGGRGHGLAGDGVDGGHLNLGRGPFQGVTLGQVQITDQEVTDAAGAGVEIFPGAAVDGIAVILNFGQHIFVQVEANNPLPGGSFGHQGIGRVEFAVVVQVFIKLVSPLKDKRASPPRPPRGGSYNSPFWGGRGAG